MRRTPRSFTSGGKRNSEEVRARLGEPRRFAYGPTPVEMLDIYTTKTPNAPINVFIHGGAWRAGEAWEFCDAAELFVHAGAHFVVPDFIDVIDAGGSLMPMAEQVRRAVAWVHKNAGELRRRPEPHLRVRPFLGRASGRHAADHRLAKDFGVPADVIKGALLSSRHVRPQAGAAVQARRYVKFTDEMEAGAAHRRHLARIDCPLIVAAGTYETPEFQRQAATLLRALKARRQAGHAASASGYNHFEMPGDARQPYGLLGRAVLEQMS